MDMNKVILCTILLVGCISAKSQSSTDDQIKIAVLAAPENQREGAKVWGYNDEGKLVVIREGTNSTVCIIRLSYLINLHISRFKCYEHVVLKFCNFKFISCSF